jgi:hypothetical protein
MPHHHNHALAGPTPCQHTLAASHAHASKQRTITVGLVLLLLRRLLLLLHAGHR